MFSFFRVGVLASVGQQSRLVLFRAASLCGFLTDGPEGRLQERSRLENKVAIEGRKTPCLYWTINTYIGWF